jgi:hypothetical protein
MQWAESAERAFVDHPIGDDLAHDVQSRADDKVRNSWGTQQPAPFNPVERAESELSSSIW